MINKELFENENLESALEKFSTKEVQLRNFIIEKYDYELTRKNVTKVVDTYIEAKYKMLLPLKEMQTSKMNDNPLINSINYSDRVGDNVEFKCDSEIEARKLEDDLNYVYERMTTQEKLYWNIIIMKHKPLSVAEEVLGLSKTGLKPIRESCIIKAGMLLGIAVLKGRSKPLNSFNSTITEIINRT